jgi:hypothetical protein
MRIPSHQASVSHPHCWECGQAVPCAGTDHGSRWSFRRRTAAAIETSNATTSAKSVSRLRADTDDVTSSRE